MFARMPFLLDQAWRFGIVASIVWPALIVWLGLVLVGVASWRNRKVTATDPSKLPFAGWLLILTLVPAVMLLIGSFGWEAAVSTPYSHPLAIALYALAFLQVACAYSLVWSIRSHRVLAFSASILGIVWGIGAFYITGFALSGTWP
jgi:hypothetical protein